MNLGLDIRIPPEYIADEQQRLRAYKRIADVKDAEQAEAMRADLADRYGPLPDAVETLLRFALLKSNAQRIGIEAVDRRGGALNIKFHPGSKIEPARLMTWFRPGRARSSHRQGFCGCRCHSRAMELQRCWIIWTDL